MSEENPNALKHFYGADLLRRMASSLGRLSSKFDQKRFRSLEKKLVSLEMKPRVQLLREELRFQLGEDFPEALRTLLKSAQGGEVRGFDLWPYTDFVQTYGLEHKRESLEGLKELTELFTAEFAVRPFLIQDQPGTLKFLKACARSSNVHHRRWACEGTRPRLPWGLRLHGLVKDPAPNFPILELLKFDEELYVRKSVSNHLNDISKDHPMKVVEILRRWKKEAGEKHQDKVSWIIHRSLRTMIKAGHPAALELIGVGKAAVSATDLKLNKEKFKVGDRLEFEFSLQSKSGKTQKLVVDYVIHFAMANRKTSKKVFKLKTFDLGPKEKRVIRKSHSLKAITTRRFYAGAHAVEIQVNGKSVLTKPWVLKV